jgi:hypothetical protein
MNGDQPPDLQALPPRGNDIVLLRPWEPADLPAIAEASTDPYIPLTLDVPSPAGLLTRLLSCWKAQPCDMTARAASGRMGSARASWLRELMPSLAKTFPRW